MAANWRPLGQTVTGSNLTTVYTVPSVTSTVVSSFVVANTTTTQITYRIAVAVAGGADALKQYLVYDKAVAAKDSDVWVMGVTLGATDVIRCQAGTTGVVVVQVFGQENS